MGDMTHSEALGDDLCCSELQCIARCGQDCGCCYRVLQCVAVCCSVLLSCVAMCCGVVQRGTMESSVFVAVCCSVL